MRLVCEICKRSRVAIARTLPTPENDSSNSTTRIFAMASSLFAKSNMAERERSPLLTRAFVAALT